MRTRVSCVLAAAASIGLLAPAAARAGGFAFTVDAFEDRPDADVGDGACDADLAAAEPQCTLRAAVEEANATLALGPGTDSCDVGAFEFAP